MCAPTRGLRRPAPVALLAALPEVTCAAPSTPAHACTTAPLVSQPLCWYQAASAAAGIDAAGPERRVLDLERALHEAQAQVATLTGEAEAARKRSDDMAAVLAAAQTAQTELTAANAALRAEQDAATAADRHAAADAAARVQQLEAEREGLITERDVAQQVGGRRIEGEGLPLAALVQSGN